MLELLRPAHRAWWGQLLSIVCVLDFIGARYCCLLANLYYLCMNQYQKSFIDQ